MQRSESAARKTRVVSLLARGEAAAFVEWLADSLERGEIRVTDEGEERRYVTAEPLRTTLEAEQRAYGGALRLRFDWEAEEHGPFSIEPA